MDLMAYKYEKNSRAFIGAELVPPYVSHDRIFYELPPNSTLEPPPQTEAGKVAMWQPHLHGRGHWIIMEDHRGEPGWLDWKGEEILILNLGNPADRGLKRRETVEMERLKGR